MSQLRRSVKGDFVVSAKFFAGVSYLYFAKTKRGLVSDEKVWNCWQYFSLGHRGMRKLDVGLCAESYTAGKELPS